MLRVIVGDLRRGSIIRTLVTLAEKRSVGLSLPCRGDGSVRTWREMRMTL